MNEKILKEETRKDIKVVWVLFIIGIMVYFCMANFAKTIRMWPDEMRYYTIAKSIFYGQGITFRGAVVDYQKLLYSIIILPFFGIQDGCIRITMISLFNCILEMIAIFPIYGIYKELGLHRWQQRMILLLYICWTETMLSMTFMAQIQFPWRYLGVATLFAMLLFLFLMLRVPKKYVATVVCVLMIISAGMMMYFTKDYNRYAEYKTFQQTKDLDSYDMGFCEYLRTGTNRKKFTNTIEKSEGILYADMVERQGNAMTVQVQVATSGGYIELPIINFKGYECVDENDNPLPIVDGTNNLIHISFADEYQGNIYINYVQPMYWCLAEWVSLIAYLILFAVQMYLNKKQTNITCGRAGKNDFIF